MRRRGRIRCALRLRMHQEADGQTLACVETEVTVLAPKLQAQKLIRTEWFYVDCLADYYHVQVFSEEHWKIIEHFVATAAHRGSIDSDTTVYSATGTAVGKERTTVQLVKMEKTADSYAFDFTDLEQLDRDVQKRRDPLF